jgi:hypothetical protein
MPRYYFNIQNGRTILDQTGVELPDAGAVLHETLKASAELLRELEGEEFWSGTPWKLWITDRPNGEGDPIFVLQYRPKGVARSEDGVIPAGSPRSHEMSSR